MDMPGNQTELILLLLSDLSKLGIISQNFFSQCRDFLIARDERFCFIAHRFCNGNMSLLEFIDSFFEAVVKNCAKIVKQACFNCSLEEGKQLSRIERESKCMLGKTSLTYGEIDEENFTTILMRTCCGSKQQTKIFYDLGSGTGRAVFAARLTQDFTVIRGIEILETLHAAALSSKVAFEELTMASLVVPNCVSFINKALLDYDWSDGDVVFANSTCFDGDLMNKISSQGEQLRPGALFITFTKALTSLKFELLERSQQSMSWGPATVFIQRRLRDDGSPLGKSPLACWDGLEASCAAFEYLRPSLDLYAAKHSPSPLSSLVSPCAAPLGGKEGEYIVPPSLTHDLSGADWTVLSPGKHVEFLFSRSCKKKIKLYKAKRSKLRELRA